MRGYVPRPDPNRYAVEKWVGRYVNYNGTGIYGFVRQAFWGGNNEPVSLTVEWAEGLVPVSTHTDSEHVTIVKDTI